MKTIGIKLADGSFYPVLQENTPSQKTLELTTAHNNQTKVMVDLYRSATCSMEDAEYVDSVQIENLVAHPNGEPDISFSVSIDKDNQLSAKIVDSETGNQSNTTITLVSRTVEERLVTDEYDVNAAAVGGGLLAAAAALAKKSENKAEETTEQTIVEEPAVESVEEPAVEESFDELIVEEPAEPTEEETFVEEPVENPIESEELPDMSIDIPQETSFDEPAADATIADDTITDETIAEDAGLPDMNFDMPEDTSTDDTIADETISDETIAEDAGLPDMNFDMPEDTSVDMFSSETTSDESDETIETEESPMFDTDESLSDMDIDFSVPDVSEPTENSEETPEMPDNFFDMDDNMNTNDNISEDAPAAGGISFTGLYDKETELGESSSSEVEEVVKKKTKVPVFICIICAIICIFATLLVLFIIPSKYNILTKNKDKASAENTVAIEKVEETAPAIKEPVPAAKEEEVVIIEKAEEVVPEQPPVVEEKLKDITYKIKWGDTLWDISETYYKNPWRYKYLAKFNGIKNPDYIISGTYITIPAE